MSMPIMRLHPPEPRVSGAQRELPYLLRGRDEEFTFLAKSLENPSQPVFVVEGPPGTGKTSLIQAIGAYAAMRGFAVINMDANQIHTPSELINRITSRILNKGHELSTTKNESTIAKLNLKIFGADRAKGATQEIAPITDIGYHLQTIANACDPRPSGFLFLIDNAASWNAHIDQEATYHLPVKEICNTLNDEYRQSFRAPIVQTIFAGLPGTIDTITELTSTRLVPKHLYRLQNVTDSAIYQIITDHLHLVPPLAPFAQSGSGIPHQTLVDIASACHGHIWHATATGQELQKLLLRDPDASDDDIRNTARTARNEVYSTIGQLVPESAIPVFAAFSAATLAFDGRLPPIPTVEMLEAVAKRQGYPLDLQQWRKNGLWEKLIRGQNYAHHDACTQPPDSPDREKSHICIPVPSLAKWFIAEHDIQLKTYNPLIRKYFGRFKSFAPWRWREEPRITPIAEPPTGLIPPHPWTGNAPQLFPLQSQDGSPPRQLAPGTRVSGEITDG